MSDPTSGRGHSPADTACWDGACPIPTTHWKRAPGCIRRTEQEPLLIVDADDLVSPEAFQRIQCHYWVLAWQGERSAPYWWDWAFSLSEPQPVPNRQMFWRRPTFAEAVQREWWFQNEREHWDRCIADYGCKLRRYCRPEPLTTPARLLQS